jgi:hypothetical protein
VFDSNNYSFLDRNELKSGVKSCAEEESEEEI